jgi:hypothetical protein
MRLAAGTKWRTHGKEEHDREGAAETEVLLARRQPLQGLRPAAGVHPEVRDVPDLLPGTRLGGQAPRGHQVKLVGIGLRDDPQPNKDGERDG